MSVARNTTSRIISACDAANALWEDPDFSPPDHQQWRRPSRGHPLFADISTGGISLVAGATGNSWLLGALSALAAYPSQLQRLFVSIRGRPHGMYTLQLFIGEAWVPLTVDDRLPHDENGRPLYSRDATSGALWVPLVEKAWAKLLGGYDELRLGYLPHALRALTSGIPLALPLHPPAPRPSAPNLLLASAPRPHLSWERLRQLVASRCPVVLIRRSEPSAATSDADADASESSPRGTRPPADAPRAAMSAAFLLEGHGGILHGLAYPVLRTRERGDGSSAAQRQVELSCPWAAWPDEDGVAESGTPSAAAESSAGPSGRWFPFEQLRELFDIAFAAAAAGGDGPVASIGSAPSMGGAAHHAVGATSPSNVTALDEFVIRLVASNEWPEVAKGTLVNTAPVPAYVLACEQPTTLLINLEQLLPPVATPPRRYGIALLLIQLSAPGGALDASRHVPGAGAHAIAHTLPAWPNRRVVLDHQAPEIPAGEYLLLPHRISTGKAPATGFRLEVEARGSGVGGAGGVAGVMGAHGGGGASSGGLLLGGGGAGAVTLRALPRGLPNGGRDVLDDLQASLGSLLLGVEKETSERAEGGRSVRRKLELLGEVPKRAAAARVVQSRVRGKLEGKRQREELEELRDLQAAREEEASSAIGAAVRGRMGRQAARRQKEALDRQRAAEEEERARQEAEERAIRLAAAERIQALARGRSGRLEASALRAGMSEEELRTRLAELRRQMPVGEDGSTAALHDLLGRFLRGEPLCPPPPPAVVSPRQPSSPPQPSPPQPSPPQPSPPATEYIYVPDDGESEGEEDFEQQRRREEEEMAREDYAARVLQGGLLGHGARREARGRRRERAARTVQAGVRGRSGRLSASELRRDREIARLRAAEAFDDQTAWLDDRLELLLSGMNAQDERRDDARDGGLFQALDGEVRSGALRYVPSHVANAARMAVGALCVPAGDEMEEEEADEEAAAAAWPSRQM